jgi:hypothetical protein
VMPVGEEPDACFVSDSTRIPDSPLR